MAEQIASALEYMVIDGLPFKLTKRTYYIINITNLPFSCVRLQHLHLDNNNKANQYNHSWARQARSFNMSYHVWIIEQR